MLLDVVPELVNVFLKRGPVMPKVGTTLDSLFGGLIKLKNKGRMQASRAASRYPVADKGCALIEGRGQKIRVKWADSEYPWPEARTTW